MAILYVRSTDGNNADNGSTWALAKATLAGAFAAASAGDIIYVSDNHAETQASAMTLTSPGTAASPCYVICVDDSAEPPTALATTATITTTGSNAIAIGAGYHYYYGITFTGATSGTTGCVSLGASLTTPYAIILKNCALKSGSGLTSATWITLGSNSTSSDDQLIKFNNVTMHSVHTSQALTINGGRFIWLNTPSALTGSTLPTTLFHTATATQSNLILVKGVDFSALGSGKNLVQIGRANCSILKFVNCKLNASASIATGTHPGPGGILLELINCDSGDTNYFDYYQDYAGKITQETTIIRTGGATDGTTAHSREMASSANANKFYPLYLPRFTNELCIWNETVGSSITLTVHIITDNVTLTDQECWLEVEYLGTSASTLSSFSDDADSDTDLLLGGSASNQATSTETWTTTGLTTPVKQQLSVTITPQEKGPIRCKVALAKPSTTVYVCTKLEVS